MFFCTLHFFVCVSAWVVKEAMPVLRCVHSDQKTSLVISEPSPGDSASLVAIFNSVRLAGL